MYIRTMMGVAGLVLLMAGGAAAAPADVENTVAATLRYSKGLKAMQQNREAVAHELTRAKAGYGPRIDLNGSVGLSKLSNTTTRPLDADKDMYGYNSIGATLTQPLWNGLATRSRVKTAEATLQSMTSRVLDNATSISLDAIIAHIDLLRRQEILRLAELNVERHRQILASSSDRARMGADTLADVTQTEGRLTRAQATLVESRASLRQAENAYRRLTGQRPPENLIPVEPLLPIYQDADTVLKEAQEHNPKILAYRQDIQAAAGERDLAKAANHPTINLETGPQYVDRHGPGNQWSYQYDVLGTVRWNIFNSGADLAGTKAATARVRQARETLFDLMDVVREEVANTWTNYMSAAEQYGFYEEAVGFNTKTRDAYLEQFTIGQRSLLDVLDAESELFNSSTQAVTARGNMLVGEYRLHALTGLMLPRLGVDVEKLYKTDYETFGFTDTGDLIHPRNK